MMGSPSNLRAHARPLTAAEKRDRARAFDRARERLGNDAPLALMGDEVSLDSIYVLRD